MSQLDSMDKGRGIAVAKPKPDIYTVLLGLALVAILTAITFLVLELGRYNWDYKAEGAKIRLTMSAPTQGAPLG